MARYVPLMHRGVVVVVVVVLAVVVVVVIPGRIWSTDHPASERRGGCSRPLSTVFPIVSVPENIPPVHLPLPSSSPLHPSAPPPAAPLLPTLLGVAVNAVRCNVCAPPLHAMQKSLHRDGIQSSRRVSIVLGNGCFLAAEKAASLTVVKIL